MMGSTAEAAAPTEAPVRSSGDAIIDIEHLARMTFGEARLEAEVLALFEQQASVLLARMHDAPPAAVAAFAHTLKGSARGIGAWCVAEAAEAVEAHAAANPGEAACTMARLRDAVAATSAAIADRLRSHCAH
jgi:HPt (histidine-containing phosphotransfer) domain-containing protein